MEPQNYLWGDWTDSHGDVHAMRYKKSWGEHTFSEEENAMLLAGNEISFPYKGRMVTGHLQYYHFGEREYFGFKSDYPASEYDPNPVFHDTHEISMFEMDLRNENDIMAEFMKRYFYAKLSNKDGTPVKDFKRVTDIKEQKKGIDLTFTQDGIRYVVDEKAQMDYIFNPEPLPTFSLELLNGSSGALGWFINNDLETEYYMFIWPHARTRPLCIDCIDYAHYALVNKKKLQLEVERRLGRNRIQLLECARKMLKEPMGEEVIGKSGRRIGYRYKENGFNGYGYLYYTLSKQERPVNLVVRRSWLEEVSDSYGTITNS